MLSVLALIALLVPLHIFVIIATNATREAPMTCMHVFLVQHKCSFRHCRRNVEEVLSKRLRHGIRNNPIFPHMRYRCSIDPHLNNSRYPRWICLILHCHNSKSSYLGQAPLERNKDHSSAAHRMHRSPEVDIGRLCSTYRPVHLYNHNL
jgi:acyl-ACP thioesterase